MQQCPNFDLSGMEIIHTTTDYSEVQNDLTLLYEYNEKNNNLELAFEYRSSVFEALLQKLKITIFLKKLNL